MTSLPMTPIGAVCRVIAGQSPPGNAYNDQGDGLPFYQGKKEFTERYLASPSVWTSYVTKRAEAGDILMSVRAPVGPINEAREEVCIGRGLAALRHGPKIEHDYLWYALSWLQPEIAGNDGAVFPSINKQQIEALEIPLPPLDEQKRIVAVLDQAFAALDRARANVEENLVAAEALFECVLLATFDKLLSYATMKTLAEVSTDFSRGKSKHRPRNDPKLYGGDYPFIQTGDVRRAQGEIQEFAQTYNQVGLAQSKLWPVGTVCITIAANIAETGVLGFESCFPDSVIGMVPDLTQAMPHYVEYMLRYFSRELKLEGKGSAQDNINLATFENSTFPFPSLAQQQIIIEKLDMLAIQVSTLRAHYQRRCEELAELRQSLLQAAFSGQLT